MYNTIIMTNKLEISKKRLIYRASYRGTKEMDILLSSFVHKYIKILGEDYRNPTIKKLLETYTNSFIEFKDAAEDFKIIMNAIQEIVTLQFYTTIKKHLIQEQTFLMIVST